MAPPSFEARLEHRRHLHFLRGRGLPFQLQLAAEDDAIDAVLATQLRREQAAVVLGRDFQGIGHVVDRLLERSSLAVYCTV